MQRVPTDVNRGRIVDRGVVALAQMISMTFCCADRRGGCGRRSGSPPLHQTENNEQSDTGRENGARKADPTRAGILDTRLRTGDWGLRGGRRSR